MIRTLLFTFAVFIHSVCFSQDFMDGTYSWSGNLKDNLGVDSQPLLADSIQEMRDQGELMDFSGGYHVGDTVADFTVYGINGEELNMSSLLEESSLSGKYTVLFSGSNSCNKFTSFFNTSTSGTTNAHTFLQDHLADFNWAMIYGYEAHPIDVENCLSNCPTAIIAGPSGVGELQHQTYEDRIMAMNRWVGIQNGSIPVPEVGYTYTPGEIEPTGEQNLNYTPLGLDIPVYADNPNNQVYDTYFKKPFGCLVIDCSGIVVYQSDWMNHMFNASDGMEFLISLLEDDEELGCIEWNEFCEFNAIDSDGDGLCDEWENFNQTDAFDVCSPYGDDSDFDGICDVSEENLGLDPFNPDSDGDFLSDGEELLIGTDPLDPDTDGDNMLDGKEIKAGTNPLEHEEETFVVADVTETPLTFDVVTDLNSNKIVVKLFEESLYSITVTTPAGQVLIEDEFNSLDYHIDSSQFNNSILVLRIKDSHGRTKSQRLFLE